MNEAPIPGPAPQPTEAPPVDPALVESVYQQLRAIAQRQMCGEREGHTLQATALVHEAWARVASPLGQTPPDRAGFLFAAARAMQQILVEHARGRGRLKRGGGRARVPLSVVDLAQECDEREIVALDDAVRRLEQRDPRAAAIVRLRFYAGLGVDETAATLGISERTVKREWQFARAWLFTHLESVQDRDEDDAAPSPHPGEQ